jgi:uncharacterized protein (DUF169 family)
MMVKNLRKLSRRLESIIRLRTTPLGIKLYRDVKEIPKRAFRPAMATVCQVPGIARYHNILVAGERGKITCPMGARALGFDDWPKNFLQTRVGEYSDNIETVRKMLLKTSLIDVGTFSGFTAAPVSKMDVVPDLISVYANTAQVLLLAYGVSWKAGDQLVCRTNGHMGECSGVIASTYVSGKPGLALPCYGARRRGLCTDSEMVVGIPTQMLEEIVESVIRTCESGRGYPIKVHGLIGHYHAHWPEIKDRLY